MSCITAPPSNPFSPATPDKSLDHHYHKWCSYSPTATRQRPPSSSCLSEYPFLYGPLWLLSHSNRRVALPTKRQSRESLGQVFKGDHVEGCRAHLSASQLSPESLSSPHPSLPLHSRPPRPSEHPSC
ncbi:hypothetical protein QCA50_011724 [Cerrena zonata]|uniref:Uncharacterized protein n=1 Tax=Cerrena zonata TaxID=2478898 RepID=A0AAW0G4W9_9APHY